MAEQRYKAVLAVVGERKTVTELAAGRPNTLKVTGVAGTGVLGTRLISGVGPSREGYPSNAATTLYDSDAIG